MSILISKEGLSTEQALTADQPRARLAARAVSSGWVNGFLDWVNAELQRPERNQMDLLYVISTTQIQTHASVAAQLMREGADRNCADLYKMLIDEYYTDHMQRVRAEARP